MARPIYTLECAFATNTDDPLASQTWTDITQYLDVQQGVNIQRGRTDEFATVQPGRMSLTLNNSDGRFTPGRAASPYSPNVVPGKRIRLGLTYPGGGVNAAENNLTSVITGWAPGGTVPPTLSASATHLISGTAALLITWGAAGTLPLATYTIDHLLIGRTYTISASVWVPVGSPNVLLTSNGVFGTASSTTGAFQRISVTFVASSRSHAVQVWPATAPAAGNQAWVHQLQAEIAAAPSTYQANAAIFTWRFTGDVDEWPVSWSGGTAGYAVTALSATDRFKRLGDLGEFRPFLSEEVLSDGPVAFFPMQEPDTTQSCGDVSGNGQAPLTVQQYGAGGTVTFGQEIVGFTTADFYEQGTVGAVFAPASATSGKYLRSVLFTPTAGLTGATVTAYVAEVAPAPVNGPVAFMVAANGSFFGIHKILTGPGVGNITAVYYDAPSGSLNEIVTVLGMSAVNQMYTAVLDYPVANFARITFYSSATAFGAASTFALQTSAKPRFTQCYVGGSPLKTEGVFQGKIAYAEFFDHPRTQPQLAVEFFTVFRGLDQQQSSSTTLSRMQKLLTYAGLYTGVGTASFVGLTSPKLAGGQNIEGNPVDAMQAVAATEDGVLMIRGDGLPEFQGRQYRFNVAASLSTTADRLDPGELSYRGDDFGLVNDFTASRNDGAMARVTNPASILLYGRRKGSATTLAATDDDLRSTAGRAVGAFGVQRNRVTGARLSLLNDAALIPTALALDVGRRITFTTIPGQAPAASVDLFVEGLTEVISEDEWSLTMNTAPADPWINFWQLNVAGHCELGVNTIVAY